MERADLSISPFGCDGLGEGGFANSGHPGLLSLLRGAHARLAVVRDGGNISLWISQGVCQRITTGAPRFHAVFLNGSRVLRDYGRICLAFCKQHDGEARDWIGQDYSRFGEARKSFTRFLPERGWKLESSLPHSDQVRAMEFDVCRPGHRRLSPADRAVRPYDRVRRASSRGLQASG
jgi:hypothetical protein